MTVGNLPHQLRIKYGLTEYPSDDQIAEWHRLTLGYVENDMEPEEAGRRAAFDAFGELDAVLLFSQADTIQTLLAKARTKE